MEYKATEGDFEEFQGRSETVEWLNMGLHEPEEKQNVYHYTKT